MTNQPESLELSKRLLECADWLDGHDEDLPDMEQLQRWAAAIRAVVVPVPDRGDGGFTAKHDAS